MHVSILESLITGFNRTVVGAISELTKFTDSPAWTKHRIDNAMDTWDDHKEDVYDFLDNAGDAISETASTIAESVGDFLGSLFD